MSVLLGLEPFQKFGVGGGGGGWVVKRHFRVPLWSKPWTWDMKLGPTKNWPFINKPEYMHFVWSKPN